MDRLSVFIFDCLFYIFLFPYAIISCGDSICKQNCTLSDNAVSFRSDNQEKPAGANMLPQDFVMQKGAGNDSRNVKI